VARYRCTDRSRRSFGADRSLHRTRFLRASVARTDACYHCRVKKLNFLLFNPDEWRGDCMGCAGDPTVLTPHADALAAHGTRFDQCHVQHPVCTPSRTSCMTGWYPHVRGHRTLWHHLRPDEPHLFRYLSEAGYDVRWYGKNDLLAPDSFANHVTEAGAHKGHGSHPANPWPMDDPRYYSFLFTAGGDPRGTDDYANVAAGIDFLRQPHDQPFCLFLPLGNPHPPYTAPQPYFDMYDPAVLPPLQPPHDAAHPLFYRRIHETRRLNEVGDETLRKIRAVYLGQISYVDWMLGELLRTLDETGLADSTVVIVFSDHGDWAGDYGLVEKWPSALDTAMTRVPCILRLPEGARGHVVRDITELIDLTPTVLDLANIALRHTQFGRSLVPQLYGAEGDPDRAAFAEGGYDPHEPHCFEGHVATEAFLRDPGHIYWPKAHLQQTEPMSVCRATMIRTATHTLVRRPLERSELYEHAADPFCRRNRYDDVDQTQTRHTLEARLLDWYIHTSDVVPVDQDPRGYPRPWMGSLH